MAEEGEKIEGWGIFDRLRNLPHVTAVKGDLVRSPCTTSMQSEIDEEGPNVQEMQAPQERQGDQFPNEPTVIHNGSAEGGAEPEIDNALSNRELLNQLQVVAVGIRDFEAPGADPQLVGEPNDAPVPPKSEELSETAPKNSSTSSSKAILKAASKVRKGVIVKESREREKLAFSDSYLEKAFGLSKPKSKSSDEKKALKPKATDGAPAKREAGWEETLPTRKKPKGTVKLRLRILPHERRVLPEAALADVVAAKEEREAAKTEMMKLLDEIRGTTKDDFKELPSDVTERWMAAHAKKLRTSLNFHCTVIRHTLASVTPRVGL